MLVFLIPAGLALGLFVGYVTRPSYMGFPIPLDLLASSNPMDAPFRSELISHLAISGVAGAVGGTILFAIVRALLSSRRP